MKNIEKEAELFGMEDEDGFSVMNTDKQDGFKAGAEWMREDLLRWHSPKDKMPCPDDPNEDYRLLIKHRDGKIFLGFYRARTDSWWESGVTGNFLIDELFVDSILWRDLYE